MKNSMIILAGAVLALAGCAKVFSPVAGPKQSETVTFTVSHDMSKAALQPDYSVVFNAGDSIRIAGSEGSHAFKTASGGAVAEFTGSLDGDTAPYYAFNPYICGFKRGENAGEFTVSVPSLQNGVKGGVDPTALISVGATNGSEVKLKNVVALVKITLSGSNITSVALCNAAGVKMAGDVKVTITSEGAPTIGAASAANVLLLPAGDAFEAGDYYIAVAPAALSGGLQLMFTRSDDDAIACKKSTTPASFVRSEVLNLGTVDTGLTWTPVKNISVNFMGDDGFSNPFSTPSSISGSVNSGTWAAQEGKALITSADNVVIPMYATKGLVKHGTYGFRFCGSAGDWFGVPQINGLTFVAFRSTQGDDKEFGAAEIRMAGSDDAVNGAARYTAEASRGKKVIWHVIDPSQAAGCRVCIAASTEFRSTKWEFLYTGEAQPTVTKVTTEAVSDVTENSAVLNGSFLAFENADASNFTCGFEYKTTGDWTSVQCGTPAFIFSYNLGGLSSGTQYTVRAWAKDAAGTVYGSEQSFSPAGKTVYTITYTKVDDAVEFDKTVSGISGSSNTDLANTVVDLPQLSGNHNVTCLYVLQNGTKSTGASYLNSGLRLSYANVGSYILLPALNGLTLSDVTVTVASGSTNSGKWGIYTESDSAVSGGALKSWGSTLPADLTFTLTGTEAGKAYKLYYGVAKNTGIVAKIDLTYTGTETATVQYVYKPKAEDGAVSAKIFVNTVTTDADLTSGLEYNAGGAGDFTAVSGAAQSSLDAGVAVISASSLVPGDVVRAWASIDGGVTRKYGAEYTVPEPEPAL